MIRDDEFPELEELRKVEAALPFRSDPNLAGMVIASANETRPIHRWFKFKESFAPGLLRDVVRQLYPSGTPPNLNILDPFSGVGTTLLSAEQFAMDEPNTTIHATGIERNPFIHFVAKAKINWRRINHSRLGDAAQKLAADPNTDYGRLPALSSIRTGRCISPHVSKRLLAVQKSIRKLPDDPTRDALLLGLAASIEPLSRVRKDGRALRIIQRSHQHIRTVLNARWAQISDDCASLESQRAAPFTSTLIKGDGRDLAGAGIPAGSVDLVFTSPPYPNNIDYTEVYKLELWLLGFIKSESGFLSLRKSTFRSHPTCAIPAPGNNFTVHRSTGTLERLLGPLLSRAQAEPWRHRLFEGYFSDMWRTLEECHRCIRKGGYAVFVVGNSLHGRHGAPYLVPTDLVVAEMARCIGLEPHETIVARNLKRRLSGNHFLRESVVIMRKTDA